MKQVLVCNSCQSDLSLPIKFLEESFTIASLNKYPEEDGISPGGAMHIEFWVWYPDDEDILEQRVWMNSEDIAGFTNLDKSLSHGCCGPNGQINTRCHCGALVGRYYSDCLMPNYFSPEPDQTQFLPFVEDEWEREAMKRERLLAANKRAKSRRRKHRKSK